MSKRSLPVDFGPITLEVNAWHDGWEAPSPAASTHRDDAMRLQRLLQGADGGSAGAGEGDDMASRQIRPGQTGNSPLPGHDFYSVVSCLKQASSVAAATANMATRVELSLSPDLLPRSSLSVEKSPEGVRFDLRVSDTEVLEGLARNLMTMAADVGKHLQEPVSLRLFGGSMTSPCKVAVWHPSGAL